jgi:hypothetical protein
MNETRYDTKEIFEISGISNHLTSFLFLKLQAGGFIFSQFCEVDGVMIV